MANKSLTILTTLIALYCVESLNADLVTIDLANQTREQFLKIIDRPKVELLAESSTVSSQDGFTHLKFSYNSDSRNRVPGIAITPSIHGKRPVVIVMHGTGGSKERMIPVMTQLAKLGFYTVAIDGRYHGARKNSNQGNSDYNKAILDTFTTGIDHPLYYDTVWDAMRLIDYLQTLPDIDSSRIGVIGFSKGGIEAYFLSAVDNRVKVSIPCIGMQSFRWELDHNDWQVRVGTFNAAFTAAAKQEGIKNPDAAFVRKFYDRVVPGIYGPFDGPIMIQLIAPRPLLVINGELDHHSPLPGLSECDEAARIAYGAANAEKFVQRIEPNTGHSVTATYQIEANNWLVRWLKP